MSALTSSPEYAELIDRIVDQRPVMGWNTPADLPPLSRDDIALVLAKRAGDVLDEIDLDPADLITYLTGSNPVGALGLCLQRVLERAAKEAIWVDVNEENECQRDEALSEPSDESPESRHGVASLFNEVYR